MRKLIIMMIGILAIGIANLTADTFHTDWIYKYRFISHKSYFDTIGSFKFEEPLECKGNFYQPFVNILKQDTVALLRKDGGKSYLLYEDRYYSKHFGNLKTCLFCYDGNSVELYTEHTVHDFDLEDGQSFIGIMTDNFIFGNTAIETVDVVGTDSIIVNNQQWKRQYITPGSRSIVVENVGGEVGLFPFTCHLLSTGFEDSVYFMGLYDSDGNLLFGPDDFDAPSGNLGIGCIPEDSDTSCDGKIYDLTGREIRNPLPGTVYIRDGRKAVAR